MRTPAQPPKIAEKPQFPKGAICNSPAREALVLQDVTGERTAIMADSISQVHENHPSLSDIYLPRAPAQESPAPKVQVFSHTRSLWRPQEVRSLEAVMGQEALIPELSGKPDEEVEIRASPH